MKRSEQIRTLNETPQWDLVIVGGGATGLGAALDAALRGYKTLLLERSDFGKGTSGRSTKLIHGGVRYLEQGNLKLVASALRERWVFLKNAPELTNKLAFILPVYQRWRLWYYWAGLKLYDFLSGKKSLGSTQLLSPEDIKQRLPAVEQKNLAGGVLYFDGQFDDSGMCIAIAETAARHGATVLNYFEVQSFHYESGKIVGLEATDQLDNKVWQIRTKGVINATGVFADAVMKKDLAVHRPVIIASQGTHIVVDTRFFPGNDAMIIPKTSDGRVLFAVPWIGKVLVGTTDGVVDHPESDPRPTEEEIQFILQNINRYIRTPIPRTDVLAAFAGLRPLVKQQGVQTTANLLRDHVIIVSQSGLLTITGGKWTTYRKMAEQAIDKAAKIAGLPKRPSKTGNVKVARPVRTPDLQNPASPPLLTGFSYTISDIRHAVRNEMAVTLEDVLARRTRVLYLDAAGAKQIAVTVAAIMREELGASEAWQHKTLERFFAEQGWADTQPGA